MILYVKDSLFTSPAKVLVNTVNTVGVMGKGIAKVFKDAYPGMFHNFQKLCEDKKFNIGQLWLYKNGHKWILNFPTKTEWRQPSRPEYIEKGLQKFVETYAEMNITSVAFPQLGCGNGELNWESTVRPMMEHYLKSLPIDVLIYLYDKQSNSPEHKDIEVTKNWLRNEPRSLPFTEVWEDLVKLIGHGLKLKGWAMDSTEFSVSVIDGPEIGLKLQIGTQGFWRRFIPYFNKPTMNKKAPRVIESGDVFIPQEALLDLWQSIRANGFCIPRTMSEGLDILSPYIIPVLAKLEYMKSVEISVPFPSQQQETGLYFHPTSHMLDLPLQSQHVVHPV